MGIQPIQRRLAAVLAADVAGYTRLMEADTDGTVVAWQAAREAVIKPEVGNHSGKIVKLTGDGFLVEFPTVQDAVNCAITMQIGLASSTLNFRIGINLGDIVDDGEDIHGEGVNIAARLEGLAEPGGICISGGVYDQVRNRIKAEYRDEGEQEVKHVSAPVRVYSIVVAAPPETPQALDLPERPSIAVLPFDNMSGEADQDHFAEGMTEDLITDLSKISGLFVVARNSSFSYKGKSVDVRTIAAELGVRYVLEGSIRKSGDRVRINAQLIDANSGGHLWAERYDGAVANVFELQDEVGAKVVSALSVQLTQAEEHCLSCVHTKNIDAYELFVQARATPYPPTPERIAKAREMFEQVIEKDPEFAGGYAGVSAMLSFGAIWSNVDESAAIEQALELAEKAIALDATFAWSYSALGRALFHGKQYEAAIDAAHKATVRQPNDAEAHSFLGMIQAVAGDTAAGVASINQALRLNPQDHSGPYLNMLCFARVLAGDYQDAVDTFNLNIAQDGPVASPALSFAAAAYEGLGQHDEALALSAQLRRDFPKFSILNWNFPPLVRDPTVRDKLMGLMLDAGVPAD